VASRVLRPNSSSKLMPGALRMSSAHHTSSGEFIRIWNYYCKSLI
jgi:hypothetical protein